VGDKKKLASVVQEYKEIRPCVSRPKWVHHGEDQRTSADVDRRGMIWSAAKVNRGGLIYDEGRHLERKRERRLPFREHGAPGLASF